MQSRVGEIRVDQEELPEYVWCLTFMPKIVKKCQSSEILDND